MPAVIAEKKKEEKQAGQKGHSIESEFTGPDFLCTEPKD